MPSTRSTSSSTKQLIHDEVPGTMNKLPQITIYFWIMKICATTLGETGGDLLSLRRHQSLRTNFSGLASLPLHAE
jgi:uncharacterized membrane-anchored protein